MIFKYASIAGAVSIAALGAGLLFWSAPTKVKSLDKTKINSQSYSIDVQDEVLIKLGQSVYVENCASCHGKDLEGQPNWQIRDENDLLPAPPHDETGHTWHHPDKVLFDLVKIGPAGMIEDYESTMPGYADVLTDEEIRASLSYIASTWPQKVKDRQKMMNDSYEANKE